MQVAGCTDSPCHLYDPILTQKKQIAISIFMSYNVCTKKDRLQGRVKFPIGGKVREPQG
jgi:hypothetical protein